MKPETKSMDFFPPRAPETFNSAETAACLGVSRSRLSKIRNDDPRFPAKIPTTSQALFWLADDIRAYAATRNRDVGRRPGPQEPRAVPRSKPRKTGVFAHNPNWQPTKLRVGRDGPVKDAYICLYPLEDNTGSCGKTIFNVLDGLDLHHCIIKGEK